MKAENSQLEDISEIRNMMERSTRFLSLSGLAGVFIGIIATIAALIAFFYLDYDVRYFDPKTYFSEELYLKTFSSYFNLILLGLVTILLTIAISIFFSQQKAKKKGLPIWNPAARRMVIHLVIPLIAGGIFCLSMLYHNLIFLMAPVTLIFYGLALINASKFTLKETQYLGLAEVILGLISAVFIGYGLIFWTIGFGFFHIIYGIWMYANYER
jgi:hypothetical protein